MDRVEARIDVLQRDLGERLGNLDRRLAGIEGWIAGRFGEEPVAST